MNKENDWFYKGKAWKNCRKTYFNSKYGLCEQCSSSGVIVHHKIHLNVNNVHDANISLNHDNLQLLCIECHNREHMFKNNNKSDEIIFDENGDVVINVNKWDMRKRVDIAPPLSKTLKRS